MTTSNKSETKLCPFCSEEIKAAAIKCKHCRKMLPQVLDRTSQEESPKPPKLDPPQNVFDRVDTPTSSSSSDSARSRRRLPQGAMWWVLITVPVIVGVSALAVLQLLVGAQSENADVPCPDSRFVDPMIKCERCFEKMRAPCNGPPCIDELKVEYNKIAIPKIRQRWEGKTPEVQAMLCSEFLKNCKKATDSAETASTRATNPLGYARSRLKTSHPLWLLCDVAAEVDRGDHVEPRTFESNPQSYDGKAIYFEGRVRKVWEEEGGNSYAVRGDGFQILVIYPTKSNIKAGTRVGVYGYAAGVHSQVSRDGSRVTAPRIAAMYVGERRKARRLGRQCE